MQAIVNAHLVTPHGVIDDGAIMFDHLIRWVGITQDCDIAGVAKVIDAKGLFVGPGLIDMHIHGLAGADASDATPTALLTLCEELPRYGVTSFVPTLVSLPWPRAKQALERVRHVMSQGVSGATVVGAHLEGPFLNPCKAGAHARAVLSQPNFTYLTDYLDVLRIVTIAPELPGGAEFLHAAKNHPSLKVAVGHSEATFEEAIGAIEQGVSHAIHLFNAMSPLHHREPGVVGAVLSSSITAELIADNIHVHPALYAVLLRCLGDRLILVSDSMRGAGLGDGTFDLGGQAVTIKHGTARLSTGELAGSTLTLNQAVHNFRAQTGVTLPQAIALASQNPAEALGLKQKGCLLVGMDADLFFFDEEINVFATLVGGEPVYRVFEGEI